MTTAPRKFGMTRADVEEIKDSELSRRFRKAEEKFGFRTGIRGSHDGLRLISLSFHPATTFWICDAAPDGTPLSEARKMDSADYSATWSLLDGPPAEPSP